LINCHSLELSFTWLYISVPIFLYANVSSNKHIFVPIILVPTSLSACFWRFNNNFWMIVVHFAAQKLEYTKSFLDHLNFHFHRLSIKFVGLKPLAPHTFWIEHRYVHCVTKLSSKLTDRWHTVSEVMHRKASWGLLPTVRLEHRHVSFL
jgi:hypothetical protein